MVYDTQKEFALVWRLILIRIVATIPAGDFKVREQCWGRRNGNGLEREWDLVFSFLLA